MSAVVISALRETSCKVQITLLHDIDEKAQSAE